MPRCRPKSEPRFNPTSVWRRRRVPLRTFALPGLIMLAGLLAAGWSWPWQSATKPTWPDIRRSIVEHYPRVAAVTTDELARWLDDPGRVHTLLLDVRTRAAYGVSHLPGAVWAETATQQRAALANQPANPPLCCIVPCAGARRRWPTGCKSGAGGPCSTLMARFYNGPTKTAPSSAPASSRRHLYILTTATGARCSTDDAGHMIPRYEFFHGPCTVLIA